MFRLKLAVIYSDINLKNEIYYILYNDKGLDILDIQCISIDNIKNFELINIPDITLIDASLFEERELLLFIDQLKSNAKDTKILLYNMREEISEQTLISLLIFGLNGYIKKDLKKQLVRAIGAVCKGELWVERKILSRFAEGKLVFAKKMEPSFNQIAHKLSPREKEIISFLANGLSNSEIANRLNLSEKTIKAHLYNIYRKLNVRNRSHLIALIMGH